MKKAKTVTMAALLIALHLAAGKGRSDGAFTIFYRQKRRETKEGQNIFQEILL